MSASFFFKISIELLNSINLLLLQDIVLFNNAESLLSLTRFNYLVELHSNGSLVWNFEDLLKSYCEVNIRYFPFDHQECSLEFQSWAQSQEEVSIDFESVKPNKSSYIYTEWKLYNLSSVVRRSNNFLYVEYILFLKRNHAYYGKRLAHSLRT